MSKSGLRNIDGINILPLDGMWRHISGVPAQEKTASLLEYAGCDFHDENKRYVGRHVVALVGIGGLPIAHDGEEDDEIQKRIEERVVGSRYIMGSAAAFSYLNSGERSIDSLYNTVMKLGHYSIAHTVSANFIVAGISEAAELELSLQRDIVHLSKLTNTRTMVQNQPPLVVRDRTHIPVVEELYPHIVAAANKLRLNHSGDTLEAVNGLYPVNKATVLMVSGDLSNLRKLAALKDDLGKELELRDVANSFHGQLAVLWPEVIDEKSKED